jgi:co-chaperonin GroES (HSP10)
MIQAANKNYVLKACGQDKETTTGIIIQRSDETELAEIVSVGPDVDKGFAVGARVIINWNSVVQVKFKSETYFVIHADHVLAVVE